MNTITFGERLSAYRQNANMTQEELALKTGVTPQAVSKWERGQSLPDIGLLADLCRVLGISADILLDTGCRASEENPPFPSDILLSLDDAALQKQIWNNLQNALEPLQIIFGTKIVPCFMNNPSYMDQLKAQRLHLSGFGYLIPVIRIRDHSSLDENEFMITARSRILHREHISTPDEHTADYIVWTFGRIIKEKYHHVLSRDIIKALTDNLKEKYPALIEGIVPEKISYGLLQDVFFHVLAGDVSGTASCEASCENPSEESQVLPRCYPSSLPEVIEMTESILRTQPHMAADEIAKIISRRLAEDRIWQIYHRNP